MATDVIYLEEIPWLSLFMDGIAFAPCFLCGGPAPLAEVPDPSNSGSWFYCLIPWGGCGQRYYVDFDPESAELLNRLAA